LADGSDPDGDKVPTLEDIKFPKAHQIAAQQIRHHANLAKDAEKRRRSLSSRKEVTNCHASPATNSIRTAHTIQEVEDAQKIRTVEDHEEPSQTR